MLSLSLSPACADGTETGEAERRTLDACSSAPHVVHRGGKSGAGLGAHISKAAPSSGEGGREVEGVAAAACML